MNLEIVTREPTYRAYSTPILFVHGMWHAAWCWNEHFLPYFAENGYVACALSLRGHGSSDGRQMLRWTSVARYLDDVEQVIRQLGTKPVLVGHSMGGLIVQKYLDSHVVPAAVLLASVSPSGLMPSTLRFFRRHPVILLKANLTLSTYPVVSTANLCRELLFSKDIPAERLAAYSARMQEESYCAYINMLFPRLRPKKRPETPLLVLGAANDAAVSVREVAKTAETYGTNPEMFSNMAHDMMLEDGWQQVADRVLMWIQSRGIK